jgi:hypothetical protein
MNKGNKAFISGTNYPCHDTRSYLEALGLETGKVKKINKVVSRLRSLPDYWIILQGLLIVLPAL